MYKGFAKFIRGKAFSILFLIVSFLSVGYTTVRIGAVLECCFAVKVYGVLFGIFLLLFGYMLLYHTSKRKIKKTRSFYELCSVVLSFLLNLVLCLLAEDFIGMFIHFSDSKVYILAIIVSVLLTVYGFLHANHIYIKHYAIPLEDRKNPVKVAFLSDIHTGTFVNKRQLRKIIDQTNRMQCDYVLIAGDTFDVDAFDYCNLSEIAEELQRLKAVKGVYAILGNHDPVSTDARMREFFQKSKIRLLVDAIIETEDFIIIGRDDINSNPKRKALTEIVQKICSDKPKILMDHNPVGIADGIQNNIDLVVCGHTHKGQFFPANLFTKWSYGKQGFYGYSKTNKTHSIVSSGAGYFQMPIRIGTNSEIVQIDIT